MENHGPMTVWVMYSVKDRSIARSWMTEKMPSVRPPKGFKITQAVVSMNAVKNLKKFVLDKDNHARLKVRYNLSYR